MKIPIPTKNMHLDMPQAEHKKHYVVYTKKKTHSFPVNERLPSIGGIGPTSSLSLRSLGMCKCQMSQVRYNILVLLYHYEQNLQNSKSLH